MRAGAWSFALLAAEKLIGFARVIVLAAFLSPREFGLFGMALLTLTALDTFTRTGFQQALIREPREIDRHLDVAWSVHLLRGLLLAALIAALAPFAAAYFHESGAARLMRAIALILVFQGASNIGVIYFQKELNFRREFLYRISGTLADLSVSVCGAWLLHSAWALVLGLIASDFTLMIVSYVIHPYRPRLRFAKGPLLDLVRYGVWVSLTGVMLFAGTRAAGLVVGKIAGATALGLYQMAYRIPQIAVREVAAAIDRIALPTYALVQHDVARLRRSYLALGGLCLALAAPAACGIAILGPPFVRFFMHADWSPMVGALVLLALSALIRVIPATGIPLFQACGAPHLGFLIQCARALALGIFIVPLTRRWGITGAAMCMVITALAGATVWLHGMRKITGWGLRDLGPLLPPLVSAAAMGAVLYPLKAWSLPYVTGSIVVRAAWLAGMVLTGLTLYVAALWIVLRISRSALLDTAREILRTRATVFIGGGR